MAFTLGLKKLPFEPDPKQIIYVGGEKDEKVTELVTRNFFFIRDFFYSQGYVFCHIPFVRDSLLHGERLHYNVPFAKSSREAEYMVSDDFILDFMLHPENRDKVTPSLLYYHPSCWNHNYPEAENQLFGIPISESSFIDNKDLSNVLSQIIDDINRHKNNIRFQRVSSGDEHILYRLGEDYEEDEERADYDFDLESRKLINEIEERIDKLCQKGIESYIIENLFRNHRRALSRIRIMKDYRIYLPDYFGMEIEMTPLPKAVYLLFLRHPEGILFKNLPDYRNELLDIYLKLRPTANPHALVQSIAEVTDPTSNSINEKCARIREAFVRKFDEHLAQNYFITGRRGEPKRIILPRKLVVWDE